MSASSNPGAGGSYRYNPETDRVELVDFTFDPYAGPHPGLEAEPEPAPAPEPEPEPEPIDPLDPLA